MHDRRIDGAPHTFGNYGALFMNAMTWWDHETSSVWSQPWGRAIEGEYKGIELFLLPSEVTTWSNWKDAHPESLAMINDLDRIGARRQGFNPNFVIGLLLSGQAKAYFYDDVQAERVLNDTFAGRPVLVWASDGGLNAYLRLVGDQVLTFRVTEHGLEDRETGSLWDPARGLAIEGPLQGEVLQAVPSTTSYDWAWLDFYPESEFYQSPGS